MYNLNVSDQILSQDFLTTVKHYIQIWIAPYLLNNINLAIYLTYLPLLHSVYYKYMNTTYHSFLEEDAYYKKIVLISPLHMIYVSLVYKIMDYVLTFHFNKNASMFTLSIISVFFIFTYNIFISYINNSITKIAAKNRIYYFFTLCGQILSILVFDVFINVASLVIYYNFVHPDLASTLLDNYINEGYDFIALLYTLLHIDNPIIYNYFDAFIEFVFFKILNL